MRGTVQYSISERADRNGSQIILRVEHLPEALITRHKGSSRAFLYFPTRIRENKRL